MNRSSMTPSSPSRLLGEHHFDDRQPHKSPAPPRRRHTLSFNSLYIIAYSILVLCLCDAILWHGPVAVLGAVRAEPPTTNSIHLDNAHYSHFVPLFRSSGSQYLFYKTKEKLYKAQEIHLDAAQSGDSSLNTIQYSFIHNGIQDHKWDTFCDFLTFNQFDSQFWIYARMKDSPTEHCSLFYGDEDDMEMHELQPAEALLQTLPQHLFPNWISLHWKDAGFAVTLVNGFQRASATKDHHQYALYQINGKKFHSIGDRSFEKPLQMPSTWFGAQVSHYDAQTQQSLAGSQLLSLSSSEKDKFFFVANNNELWSLVESADRKPKMSKIGSLDLSKLGQPPSSETLKDRILFFLNQEKPADDTTTSETPLVLSTDGTIGGSNVIYRFNSSTSPRLMTRSSKIVEYKKPDGSTKYYYYFLVRQTVQVHQLKDLSGVKPEEKPHYEENSTDASATPVWEQGERDRVQLYRCCIHSCSPIDIHQATINANTDDWEDPQVLMTNPYYPRGLFVGTHSSIVLIIDDRVLPVVKVDPMKQQLRLLHTNGLNIFYQVCPVNSADTDSVCSIHIHTQQQETRTLADQVAPDAFIVDDNEDGSQLQLLTQNATGLRFESISTGISGGCSPACGPHGKCTLDESGKKFVCKCEAHFRGAACDQCEGDYSGPNCNIKCTKDTCQHGTCVKDVGCVCDYSEEKGYWTYLDENNLCGTCKYNLDPAQGCKMGKCKPNYFGEKCDRYCYPPSTCSNHGVCSKDGFCDCFKSPSLGYWTGYQCEQCQENYSPSSGCTTCLAGFSGVNCTRAECFGIPASSPEVCSGRGKCVNNHCECDNAQEVFGYQCEYFHCFGVENKSPRSCSGHGSCINPDECVCSDGWNGPDCSKEGSSAGIFWSSVLFVGVSSMAVVGLGTFAWKRYQSYGSRYERWGFSQLNGGDNAQGYELGVVDNVVSSSDTEDFDSASTNSDFGPGGPRQYDTDDSDNVLRHDHF